METKETRNWFAKLHYLHYVYIIFILLLSLVAYVAFCHSSGTEEDKQLLTFLGFAATVSSIILSVLAIIITVISSGATDRLRDSVIQISSLPKEIAEKFSRSTEELDNASKKIVELTEKNEELTSKNIDIIQERINQLAKDFDTHYRGHDEKIDYYSHLVEEAIKQKELGGGLGYNVNSDNGLTEEQISIFLERTSKATIVLLYFIERIIEMHISKPVSLTTFAEVIGYKGENSLMAKYCFGSIVQMNSVQLVDYSNDSSDLDMIRFIRIDDSLKSELGKHMQGVEQATAKVDSFVASLVENSSEEGEKEE